MPEQIKKKVVLISLEDVLVPGKVIKEVNKKGIKEILENLSKLDKEGKITLILVSGFKKDVMEKKISENSLGKFFRPENIHCATEDYISKREEVDRKRHEKNIKENPSFNDAYVKVQVVDLLMMSGIPGEDIIYFGHDLMTDAFYLHRYTGIDAALLKQSLSLNHAKAKMIKGLIYVNLTWQDFKKVIYGKRKVESYAGLETMIFTMLKEQLFGDTLLKKYVTKRS
jgi:hypothetical protein